MTFTVRTLIGASMRLCGASDHGERLDEEEYNDALGVLNAMLDAWRIERLMLPYTRSDNYETVIGQQVYTVGDGGDWDGARPQKLRYVTLRDGAIDYPLTRLEHDDYANITYKGETSQIASHYYYEPQFPLARLTLYPVPEKEVAIILSFEGFFETLTLDSDLSGLAPGYQLAMRYNLAVLLADEFREKVKDSVRHTAREAKAALKASNAQSLDAVYDYRLPGVQKGFNILNG